MWAVIQSSGWTIWPIVLSSVVALALVLERFWFLKKDKVLSPDLINRIRAEVERGGGVTGELVQRVAEEGMLGHVLASGLRYVRAPREVMKESIESSGRMVAHELERFLPTLATIASMAPLLGLLGTVFGMIDIFGAQSGASSNPQQLAHGIALALYNTAAGLIVAIPTLIFYRYFRSKVDGMIMEMERQALQLVELVHHQSTLVE
ncbi:MAG: MotA/TolQ/ExbB proton channel family protein [Pseudomonadota bacterium]